MIGLLFHGIENTDDFIGCKCDKEETVKIFAEEYIDIREEGAKTRKTCSI